MALRSDFLWGFATASYQTEGAVDEDGRGPSIWDTFCQQPGRIADGSSGAVACDAYHRTAEDVALLRQLGATAYRFWVSWTRVVPLGGRHDPVNQRGLDHYAALVDALLAAGITPFVTLSHWDVPEALDRRYGGPLDQHEFGLDFERYARVVFAALPRVRFWITFNEPWCSAVLGYGLGQFAPGRCSDRARSLAGGDSATEPWLVGHALLLAHARAVRAYRADFAPATGGTGRIAMVLNGDAAFPWDATDADDVAACQRKLEFSIAWFADPIYRGDYPPSMRRQLGARLPVFSAAERDLVRGSNDFYAMNHYTANYIRHRRGPAAAADYAGNVDVLATNRHGDCIGPETQCPWLRPCAPGFRDLLGWISRRYSHPPIYVAENGTSIKGESDLPRAAALDDDFRVRYYQSYIAAMADAVRLDGVDVRAYLAWSLLDNFEWSEGYHTRFDVCYVDYEHGQARYPKKSARALKPLFDSLIKKSDDDRVAEQARGTESQGAMESEATADHER